MNRGEVNSYFELLQTLLIEHDLMDRPGHIYNVDETGLQLCTEPDAVIAEKGSKAVHVVKPAERGETVTVFFCCNAEGNFLPPYCIFKGVYEKEEYKTGLPPGSTIRMNRKSAYINSEIFMHWLKHHFVPRKPPGKVLLILDGHSSHMSNVEMLDYAEANNVVIFCLPSHTTAWLQPLDVGVFKSFKFFWRETCNTFFANKHQAINRMKFGALLASAWRKSATIQNATHAFEATGIYPYNPEKIPDHAFLTSVPENQIAQSSVTPLSINTGPFSGSPGSPPTSSGSSLSAVTSNTSDLTPSKLMNSLCPVPALQPSINKRGKQHAMVVTKTAVEKKVSPSPFYCGLPSL